MTDRTTREETNDRRVGTLLMLGLLVLFGGIYVAGYYFTGDMVPRGATVAGVPIGGRSPQEAERLLERELAQDATSPISVTAGETRRRIYPAEAGLSYDIQASVAQAGGGRSWDPLRMWEVLVGGSDHEPVVDVDDSALAGVVASVAESVDQAAQDGDVVFHRHRVRTRPARTGVELDRAVAEERVLAAFLAREDSTELEVDEVEPEITDAEVRAFMDGFANPAMSAPVVIVLDGEPLVFRPARYAPALGAENQDGALVPVLDEELFAERLVPLMDRLGQAPRDATVRLVDGQPQVIPSRKGIGFDVDDVSERFLSVVVRRGDQRRIRVTPVERKPSFTTRQARRLRIREVVSEFTTFYPHADYRNVNLGRAAELVNGTVLKPGETFSLNDTVGERTAANGFTEGFIIANGVLKEDFGGGVSQVATTLFNGAFFAGLEDVEHKPHSFYIDRYPVGREATVAWGYLDLKFKNDTPHGILIQAWITPSSSGGSGAMNVRFWSTKHWDIRARTSDRFNYTQPQVRYNPSDSCVEQSGSSGFDVNVYRDFYRPGSNERVKTETFFTRYIPADEVNCYSEPQQQRNRGSNNGSSSEDG